MIENTNKETLWELIMRFSPAAIALSLTLAMISSAGIGKKADNDIDQRSVALLTEGEALAKANKLEMAIDYFETALAVDPRNRAAYIAIARASRSQGLSGKSIRMYKEALELDPNDLTALSEQGGVMVAKGAVDQAKANLSRMRVLCRADCGRVNSLALLIDNAGKKPVLQASAVAITPVAGDASATKPEKIN